MNSTAALSSPVTSPFAPLGRRAFAILWVATVASNVGTWMNDVGAGWLMTELSPSPATVALVQAATTLPVFLFALRPGRSRTSSTGAACCSESTWRWP